VSQTSPWPRFVANSKTDGLIAAAQHACPEATKLSAVFLSLCAQAMLRPGGSPVQGLQALAITAGAILSHIPDQSERDAALVRFEQLTALFAEQASK
jgi:hypothetical protein